VENPPEETPSWQERFADDLIVSSIATEEYLVDYTGYGGLTGLDVTEYWSETALNWTDGFDSLHLPNVQQKKKKKKEKRKTQGKREHKKIRL